MSLSTVIGIRRYSDIVFKIKEMKKSKHLQATKGNLKISNFFTKLNKSSCKEKTDILNIKGVKQSCNNLPNKIIVVDSDDDFVNVPDKTNISKESTLVTEACSSTDIRGSTSPVIKKRKLRDVNTHCPPQKRSNVVVETKVSPNCQPSTSDCDPGNTPPWKDSCGQVFVKSPDKLLSPAALREYHTPEKKLERFLEKIKTPTPKKVLFNEEGVIRSSVKPSDTFLSIVHELRETKKNTKMSPKKSTHHIPKINEEREVQNEQTPNKLKKTPKKLYDKSPKNLNEFNVQIIDNFVKITPSKSNKKDANIEIVTSNEKKQSSILKYISPSASARSAEAQRHNESTPTKQSPAQSVSQIENQTPKSRVKAKLDFSDCDMEKASSSHKTLTTVELSKEGRIKSPKKSVSPPSKRNGQHLNEGQENDLNFINVDLTFDEDWHEELLIPSQTDYDLDLTESQHCKVISVSPSLTKNVITLKSTKNGEQAICNVEGFWIHMQLSVGDTVHASAKKLNQREWIINNDYGLLVYEPDLLVSTTSVVNTLWCKRRSVLSERFRGFEPSNQQMLVGTLVHSLLQHVLKNRYTTPQKIEEVTKDLVKQRNIISSLYECGIKLDVIEGELMKFVPKIVNFMKLYVRNSNYNESNSNLRHNIDDWKGTIETIEDIEENIWCPELGIKGKVDVSIKTNFNTMPLELKTGRASVSLEHRGQVMMYIMMMNKLGYNVPSGLLLYLREGVLKEVPPSQKEERDIIILRNELAYYLTRKPKIIEDEFGKKVKLFPPDLPEPINHQSCAKCPYSVICTAYAKYNNEDISSKKTLKNIQNEVFSYLKDSHLNYLMHWISLTALESNSTKGTKDLREIYTLTPKERENNGKCIINLKVTNVEEECNGVFEHTLKKIDDQPGVNFFANGIMESNYVVVSVSNRPAVSAGFVTNITANSITVTLDRNLNKKHANRTFHIDSYDSSSLQSYNLASLMLLMELSPRAEQLRRIIIDKVPPTFKPTLPKLIGTKGKQILRRLNIVQQRAVLKAIAAKEYFLIKGMPGTGKTSTIVALIQLLVELEKSVLITSHTHSAVDNVCMRLVNYGVKLLRLGSESRIHPSMKKYSEHSLTGNCRTPEELEAVYNSVQVLAVTCLGSGHPVLSKRTMDICIVDESTQVVQSSVIRPLYAAKTFILIGDPDQLPAVIKDKTAIEMGMSESLFERLYTKEATIALNLNYRMNTTITALANYLTYNRELLIGNDGVANASLKLPNREVLTSTYKDYNWILRALDESLDNAVQFIDTGPVWKFKHDVPWLTHKSDERSNTSENQSCVNVYEASVVVHIVTALIQAGAPPDEIGVIATYRAQVAQISVLLQGNNVDVSTVDQFQGKDKNVIIYSSTKSRDISATKMDNQFELLEDKRRLTVAITRAKHKLIVIGDCATLKQYSTFNKLMPCIEKNLIKLQETKNFDWEQILDINRSI